MPPHAAPRHPSTLATPRSTVPASRPPFPTGTYEPCLTPWNLHERIQPPHARTRRGTGVRENCTNCHPIARVNPSDRPSPLPKFDETNPSRVPGAPDEPNGSAPGLRHATAFRTNDFHRRHEQTRKLPRPATNRAQVQGSAAPRKTNPGPHPAPARRRLTHRPRPAMQGRTRGRRRTDEL